MCVYVLAAGKSERFGSEKLLVKLNGKTMLERSTEIASWAGEPTLIAKPNFPVPEGVRSIENPDFEMGISTSVRLAVKDAVKRGCEEIVFFLADMPFIQRETVLKILSEAKSTEKPLIYPVYKGKKGFPTVVKSDAFSFLSEIEGDEGVKRVINNHPDMCLEVMVNDPWCAFDVDTPEDLKRAAAEGRSY
jgi:molybdenum cofactor cytidylyltransferase